MHLLVSDCNITCVEDYVCLFVNHFVYSKQIIFSKTLSKEEVFYHSCNS